MFTKEQMPWVEYATFDEDGFINGVCEDAPSEVKKAYEDHQKEISKHIKNGTKIPK